MKYSELSEFAQSDLNRVLQWLEESGQHSHSIGKLRQAMMSTSPIIEKHILNTLNDGEYSAASAYTKRLVGWLMAYATDIQQAEPHVKPEYSRDRAARLKSAKLSLPDDVVSTQQRVTLSVDLAQWWEKMTPEQRGAWIAEHYSE